MLRSKWIASSANRTNPKASSNSFAAPSRNIPPEVKKLGILLSCPPTHPNFTHALELARAAGRRHVQVYLYCIDEAVTGIATDDLQELKRQGLVLFGCAFSARCRNIPIDDRAAYSGLTVVSDLMASTDRFLAFNA